MADNTTTEQVIRLTADTSSIDQSLDRSEARVNKFKNGMKNMSESFARMWSNMSDRLGGSIRQSADAFESMSLDKLIHDADAYDRKLASLLAKYEQMNRSNAGRSSGRFEALINDIDTMSSKLNAINGIIDSRLPSEISRIREEMSKIAEVDTEEFARIKHNILEDEAALDKLIKKERMLKEAGVDENSRAFQNLGYSINQIENDLTILNAEYDRIVESGRQFEPISGNNATVYRQLSRELEAYEQRLAESGSRVDAQIDRQDIAFARLASSVRHVGNNISKFIGSSLQKSFKIAENAVKSISKKFTELNKNTQSVKKSMDKFAKSFTSVMTRIKLRVKNLIISSLFEDVKANFGKIAQLSPAFNKSVSGMIDSVKQLGAQIIAALEPIITKLGPVITYITDKVTSGADAVSQFVARLAGQDTYIQATKGSSDYAKSLDNATKSTKKAASANKELKNSILGFDQLNKLSGDGDALGIDDAKLNSALTKSSALNKIADNIREAFKSGNFVEFGKSIANAVNSAFGWLDKTIGWSKNSEKLTKALRHVIDTVNGFFKGINPQKIGKTIGDGFNSIINSFAILTDPNKGIYFGSIGKSVGEAIIAAFATIDWHTLGADIVQGLQSGISFINGLLTANILDDVTGQMLTIGTVIGNSLNNMFTGAINAVNPADWGNLIANLVNNLTGLVTGLFGDTSNVVMMATKLGSAINTAIAGINADQLASAIMSLINTFLDFFSTLFQSIDWGGVWNLLVDTLSSQNVDWLKIIEAIGLAALPSIIVGTLTTGLSALGTTIGSAAATIASSPVVLTAAAAAFGVAGAAYGVKSVIEAAPHINDEVKSELGKIQLSSVYGSADFSNFNAWGKDFRVWAAKNISGGGDIGAAAMHAAISGEAVEDANSKFVLFGDKLYTAQEYMDLFANGVDGINSQFLDLDGNLISVTDQMRDVAEHLIAQGTAVDNSASALSTGFDPAVDNAKTSLDNFSAGLDHVSQAMTQIGTSTSGSVFDGLRSMFNIPHFAQGGVVGDGQLFIANEGGVAELITRDGGNTAIVNNEQIISAVVTGVKQAVLEAGYIIADKVVDNNNQSGGDIVLVADNVELARAASRGQRQIDRRGNHTVAFA